MLSIASDRLAKGVPGRLKVPLLPELAATLKAMMEFGFWRPCWSTGAIKGSRHSLVRHDRGGCSPR